VIFLLNQVMYTLTRRGSTFAGLMININVMLLKSKII
jgi:hypothetical protein